MKNLFLVLICFLISACDFTTGVSRRILKAQEYVDKYQYQEALDEYHLLVQLNLPKKIEHKVYYQMAEIYSLYLFDKQNALKFYKKVESSPTGGKLKRASMIKSANLCFELRKYTNAIEYYEKFIFLNSFTDEEKKFYQMQIGISYFEQNEWSKSKKVLMQISTEPQNRFRAKAYFYLGQIFLYEANSNEAISLWEKSIKYETESAQKIETKFYIANAYEKENDLEKAYKYYYSIIDFYPNPEIIKKRLERVYQRKVSRRR